MIFNIGTAPIRKLPVLDASYPQDVSASEVGASATFKVIIAEDGKPSEYSYQWYYDETAVSGATKSNYTLNIAYGSHSVYCIVTNKAGSVKSRTATLAGTKLYLYKSGDECKSISGGWNLASNNGNIQMSLSKGSSYMTLSSTWTNNYTSHACCSAVNKVDVSQYAKLNVQYDYSYTISTMSGAGECYSTLNFGLGTSRTSVSSASVSASKGTSKTVSVDISALKTSLYVVANSRNYGNNGTINIKIRNVWLS